MLILANVFGYLYSHWRIAASVAAFLAILGLTVALSRSCGHKPVKLNEKETHEAQIAIEEHNDDKLREVLAENDQREQQADTLVTESEANTQKAVEDAKAKYAGMSNDELRKELEARK